MSMTQTSSDAEGVNAEGGDGDNASVAPTEVKCLVCDTDDDVEIIEVSPGEVVVVSDAEDEEFVEVVCKDETADNNEGADEACALPQSSDLPEASASSQAAAFPRASTLVDAAVQTDPLTPEEDEMLAYAIKLEHKKRRKHHSKQKRRHRHQKDDVEK